MVSGLEDDKIPSLDLSYSETINYSKTIIFSYWSLAKHFDMMSFHLVRRSTNLLAHTLTRTTNSLIDLHIWLFLVPSCI